MDKFLSYILRFGPLVAAFALGLGAVIEQWVPGYTGILNSILSALALFGVNPDASVVAEVGNLVAGAFALLGVARKLISIVKKYFASVPVA